MYHRLDSQYVVLVMQCGVAWTIVTISKWLITSHCASWHHITRTISYDGTHTIFQCLFLFMLCLAALLTRHCELGLRQNQLLSTTIWSTHSTIHSVYMYIDVICDDVIISTCSIAEGSNPFSIMESHKYGVATWAIGRNILPHHLPTLMI